MTDEIRVVLRDATPNDRNFIIATWIQGYYYDKEPKVRPPAAQYYKEYGKVIEEVLNLPEIRVEIAGMEDDPLWIAGFVVYRGKEIYWIFVRKGFRRKGIARLLLSDKKISIIKSITKMGDLLSHKLTKERPCQP